MFEIGFFPSYAIKEAVRALTVFETRSTFELQTRSSKMSEIREESL